MPGDGNVPPSRDPRRSRLSWHIRKPTYGPKRLAVKNHFIAMCGEMVGTTLFMMFALGGTTVANMGETSVTGQTHPGQDGSTATIPNTSNLLYIAFSFGISLTVIAWCFYRVSGGLFNPAVTLGMLLVGALSPLRAALLVVSQILGGITGAAIIQALLPGTLNVRTTLADGVSIARGLFIEIFLTTFSANSLLLAAEKHRGNFIAPLPIGLSLFSSELVSVFWTGGSLNPARTFGPCVVLKDFTRYHWIYWLGPVLGATIAAGFYRFIKFLEYETVLGPEPSEECHHPVLQLSPSATPSAGNVPAGEGVDPSEGYMIEGTGFGDLLHSISSESRNSPSGQHRHPSLPAYDARFDKLENMLARLLEQGELSKIDHGTEAGHKGSLAATLVEHPPYGHEKV
uniref:BY PROTMAP: gi/472588445/gb/EMS25917.1/ water channel [Rhodosporidium toruloides NP11] gi/647396237/emb/CDR38261.1/ RHTO0S03e07030g1_1 [Rhodosporidium toruloides] n=1 Tax=Rhodotorula toruloides TaxID=5286 RepID=A0A0K3C7V8_RHOTO